jgi:predicted nicotinamide N-methyase
MSEECTQIIVHPTLSRGILSVVIPTLQKTREVVVVFPRGGPCLYKFQQGEDIENVGKVVWQSGIYLGQYLANLEGREGAIKCKRALEIGCGGAPLSSLILGEMGINTVATDGDEDVLKLADGNARDNWQNFSQWSGRNHRPESCRPLCARLRWGNDDDLRSVSRLTNAERFDLIVAADVIYFEAAHEILLETLEKLTTAESIVYIAFQIRLHAFEGTFFSEKIQRYGFEAEIVWKSNSKPEVQIARLQKTACVGKPLPS